MSFRRRFPDAVVHNQPMSVPFIGRADETRALRSLISAARRGGAPTAGLITGEPGTGKSRLLRESLRGADPDRTVVVAGFEPVEPIPLAALGDLVRRLATVPGDGPRLASLVFGSDGRRAETALPVFEATHRALMAFGPLTLAVDDLQWIDAQSMALLHYLVRAAESSGRPLVVLAASRHSAAAASYATAIDGVLPAARRRTIDLRGLARDDGVALAQAIDAGLSGSAAEDVWRRAAGSPFWLEALARARDAGDAVDLVGERLRSISADAADVVCALAVVARPATRDELGALKGWPTSRLEQAIRELLARGLVSEPPGAVRLAHDLIREAAGAAVPAATARRLHTRLVEVIEANAGDDLALLAEALDHRTAAGLPTLPLAKRLIAAPGRRLIGPDLFGRLAAIAEAQPAGTADQVELDEALGTIASEQGEQDLAIRHWSRVAVTAEDPRERQHADLEAGRASYAAGRAADVNAHLGRARSHPPDAVTAIELDTVEAETLLWIEHQTPQGAAMAQRAVARGREVAASADGIRGLPRGTRAALLAALGAANDAALQEERAEDIVRLGREALELADGLGAEARLAALLRTAFPLWTIGLWRDAEERYREAWAIAHRLVLPVAMIEAGLGFARVLHGLGRIDEARAIATEANALEARIRPWRRWDTSQAVLHMIELSLGEPGAIGRLRADARRVEPHFGIAVHQLAAVWASRVGKRSAAQDVELELEAARACSAEARCPRCGRELLVLSAELHARHGRVDQARHELATWESTYRGPDYPALRQWRVRARSAIAVASGDPAAADLLAEVVTASDAMGLAEDAVWARLDLGRVLLASGDRRAAVSAYTKAAARARALGAVGAARVASRALRELGVRAWRRGAHEAAAGALDALSARELEIARLVAQGSSNREIAALLALSPRTVERHMTNSLAKLGARNRTELAAIVHTASVRGSADD
ncbi:MAG TPA: AAA family ATPase [Candidatus Limnocylindrales bacterium]|nr:AAA family ATPase [Candidatus Limnocylindrales bacterium]